MLISDFDAKYRAFFESAPVGMAIVDSKTGRFVKINQSYCNFLGYSMDEMMTKDFRDVTIEDDLSETLRNMALLKKGEIESFSVEKRYRTRRGDIVWGNLTASRLWSPGEAPTFHIAIVEDITEKKETASELDRQSALFEGVYRDVPDAMVLADLDKKITLVNPAFSKIFGYALEEVLGKDALGLYRDQEEFDRAEERRLSLSAEEKMLPSVAQYRRKNGEVFSGETVGSVIRDHDGKAIALLGVIRDITARETATRKLKDSEEKFRGYFDLGLIGMAITSLEKGWVEFNDELCDIFGYSREELMHLGWAELTHPEDLDADVAQFNRVLSGEIDGYSMEKRFIRKDGKIINASISAKCVRKESGEVDYFVALVQDISNRVIAQQNFQNFVEGSIQGIYIHRQWQLLFVNEAMAEICGYENVDDLMAIGTIEKAIAPHEIERLRSFREAREKGQKVPLRHEAEFIKKDGSYVWVESLNSLIDWDGEPAIQSTVIDITDRKRHEKNANERNKMIELLQRVAVAANEAESIDEALETSLGLVCSFAGWPIGHAYKLDETENVLVPTGIWNVDHTAKFIEFKALTETFQFKPGQGLPGRVLASGDPEWIENTKEDPNFLRKQEGVEVGVESGFAFPIKVGSKTVAVLEFFSESVSSAQSSLYEVMDFVASQIGRTFERKMAEASLLDSERRFRDFAESASDWFWETDEHHLFTYISEGDRGPDAFDPTLYIGKCRYDITKEKQDNEKWLRHRKDLEEHKPIKNFTYDFESESGTRSIQISGVPLFNGEGNFIGYRGTGSDISEHRKSELAVVAAKEEAEQASKAKTEFLASMSHELRTPLNAVLGFAQMLQYDPKTPLTSSQEESVGNIIEGGQHLLELVNDILDLVRIEAHQVSLSVQKVDANEIVKNCVDLSLPLGQPNGVEIIDGLSDRAPFLLRADEVRLKQILLNLLSNAVKYNRPNGKVVVDGWETKNKFLRLEVSDTGIGITKEDFQGVFEVFQRIDADPMVAREGTGIGLSVSKLLVEKMAGRIGFESELGVGSTFWVELPLASKRDVLIWGDTMRTGNDQIDRDHQVLVALLNKTAQNDIKEAQVDDVLSELVEYTHKHFRREEKIMKLCGYPELDKHCRIHEKLSSQVQSLSDQWQHNRSEENLDALRLFLRDWLFDHIINVDTKLTAYISGPKKNS